MIDIDLKDVNATWANNIATTQLGELAAKQLREILTKIKDAACKNKFEISVQSIETINQTELKSRGFKVKHNNGDPRDHSDFGCYTINW